MLRLVPSIVGLVLSCGFVASAHSQGIFDKGGALSIDKPFDKGGALSIDKPFDKGGALSINKVYVPEKLRIGAVKSLAEVIIPLCWGSPQDCRGMKGDEAKRAAIKEVSETFPYYVIGRFTCLDVKTREISGKQCDVTQASSRLCSEAKSALQSYPRISGDPCKKCADIYDASEVWDRNPPEQIQGGPCQVR